MNSIKTIESLPTRYYHGLSLPSISTTMVILSFFANFGTSMSRNIMFTLITSMTDVTQPERTSSMNSSDAEPEVKNFTKNTKYEFEWTEMEQNWVMNAYLAGLLVMTIPSGYLAFRIGPKIVAATGGALTILINCLSPLSARHTLNLFIFMRFILGAAVSTVMPSVLQIVSNWVPENNRGISLAVITSGSMVGSIVLNIVSSYMTQSYGWSSVFYLVTVLNACWVILWIIFVADTPEQHSWIFEDEVEFIRRSLPGASMGRISKRSCNSKGSKPPPYHKMLKNRSVWVTIFVKMAQNFYYYVAIIKLQYYQTAHLKTTFEENCIYTAIFHVAILLSINIGGFVTDFMLTNHYEVSLIRKLSETTSGFITLYFLLMLPFCETKSSYGIVMFLSAFGNGLNVGGSGAALLDLTTDYVANLTSLINFITLFVGWATPLIVTGLLKISDGDWSIVFITSALALFLSSVAFGLYVKPENQKWELPTFLTTTMPKRKKFQVKENNVHYNYKNNVEDNKNKNR